MNKVKQTILHKKQNVLNVYFTAGYPTLDSTVQTIRTLSESGADIIEVGMPYSDPLADGPTIQASSSVALANGMNMAILFDQLASIKESNTTPLILMGYYNQMIQYGEEKFLKSCAESGISALIIPDMPMYIYESQYKALFEKYNIGISFLITPATSDERIKEADRLSSAFVYAVSQTSITGGQSSMGATHESYFNHLNSLNLESPVLIGFGIHDRKTFSTACAYAHGAIVGSGFIRTQQQGGDIAAYIKSLTQKS
jgi:tryptophan synthase alpha chain